MTSTVAALGHPPPAAPGALPLVGHGLGLYRDPLRLLLRLHRPGTGPGVLRLLLGRRPIVLVTRRELVHRILVTDPHPYDKGGPFFDFIRYMAGNGLATCNNADHRVQRPLVQPAFHPTAISSYGPVVADAGRRVVDDWHDGQTLDVSEEAMKLATLTVLGTLFRDADFAQAVTDSVRTFPQLEKDGFIRMVLPPSLHRLPLPALRRVDRGRELIRTALAGAIAAHRATGADGNEVLSRLMAATGPDGTPAFTETDLVDQVFTLIGAGVETSASSVASALHLLATDQDVQHRLRAELADVLGGRDPVAEDLPRLPLLGRVVTETLRLYPSVWLVSRVTTAPVELGGHRIPAGVDVVFSPYCLHRDPEVFPRPASFDPDRWLPERAGRAQRQALIPFSTGRRKCVGDTLAMNEIALFLASALTRYRFRHAPGSRSRPTALATLSLAGIRLTVHRLTDPGADSGFDGHQPAEPAR
ncbi:cytochrome P450 [Streptomyces clavuligerus]|uniref:cytochrome P450 n=1 Tax=Streptomyces clavuligerus TaxID=1901 RepID=UPI0018D1BA16|nr:cytochrome P450 [Streptomyces clavuligerus]